jgi:hypothetical protein
MGLGPQLLYMDKLNSIQQENKEFYEVVPSIPPHEAPSQIFPTVKALLTSSNQIFLPFRTSLLAADFFNLVPSEQVLDEPHRHEMKPCFPVQWMTTTA